MLISFKNKEILHHILLIDNYDSFTFNLYHYLEGMNCAVDVVRNNELDLSKLSQYDAVILSPGPGLPREHKNVMEVLRICDSKIPVLGVCLGMQAIALHLGGELSNKEKVSHGVEAEIETKQNAVLFNRLPAHFKVGLYHSWKVTESENYSSDAFAVSDGTLMAISRDDRLLFGIQFHPESIMTEFGKEILLNFLKTKKVTK